MSMSCLLELLTLPVFVWTGENPHIPVGPQIGAFSGGPEVKGQASIKYEASLLS